MNYWHLQLNPGIIKLNFDKVKNILEKKEVIGMSDTWDNKNGKSSPDPEKFKEQMKIGDVVMIRTGKTPVALTKVKGDYFIDHNVDQTFDWFNLRRPVEILGYYNTPTSRSLHDQVLSAYGKGYIQSPGTLNICSGDNATNTFIKRWYNSILKNIQMNDFKKILAYKKQIILQGPPGTGKTRLAKLLAQQLNKFEAITSDDIRKLIHPNQKIITASKTASFHIIDVKDDHLNYRRDSTKAEAKLSFEDIKNAFKNKLWEYNKIKNGSDTYSAAVALFLYNQLTNNHWKLIQFHPSYAYEDFVRGISAKSDGGNIVYETENKILASFAQEAKDNLESINKGVEEISRAQQIENLLAQFSEKIQDTIDEQRDYKITDAVSILVVEEDAFRYTGDWKTSQRMKFKDLVLAQLSGVKTRQELRKLKGVSGLARHHASYFVKVLNLFQKEFANELSNSVTETAEKPTLKNYVLIIDEINRANLPAVLGELIYALEYRNEAVDSMYALDGDNQITLPENLYIIGTMNTADRSVGQIDYAIKRRFAFVDVLPDESIISNGKAKELFQLVATLFVKEENGKRVNSSFLAPDFEYKDVQLGHSYFLLKDGTLEEQKTELEMRLKYEIVPILKEYVKDGLLLENAISKIDKIANFEC